MRLDAEDESADVECRRSIGVWVAVAAIILITGIGGFKWLSSRYEEWNREGPLLLCVVTRESDLSRVANAGEIAGPGEFGCESGELTVCGRAPAGNIEPSTFRSAACDGGLPVIDQVRSGRRSLVP